MASSVVEICNRALQKVGAQRITSITENTKNARSCAACYEPLKLKLLRSHIWGFAIARATLAADSTVPDWGRGNAFQLPSDFVRLAPDYAETNTLQRDYAIEGQKILTDFSDPLYIRYIKNVTDANVMDPIFRELLAAEMAVEMCEEMTQSRTKKETLISERAAIFAEARKANAFEKPASVPPEDDWISVRV